MSKLWLGLVAVVVMFAAMITPSRNVRAQSATPFDYARVAPFVVNTTVGPNRVQQSTGYRACIAGKDEWTCRDFKPTDSTDALRTALATLGSEGWELVSVLDENPPNYSPHGLTYFFKRPR